MGSRQTRIPPPKEPYYYKLWEEHTHLQIKFYDYGSVLEPKPVSVCIELAVADAVIAHGDESGSRMTSAVRYTHEPAELSMLPGAAMTWGLWQDVIGALNVFTTAYDNIAFHFDIEDADDVSPVFGSGSLASV